jgi:predicted NAD-dependent protein-ADP-ribosyltransferase YbiA (DUF1768 family)
MSTSELVNDFSKFAAVRLSGTTQPSIDELYEEWRASTFQDIDAAAVMASVRDLEAGERGRPVSEFLAEFDRERTSQG